MIRARSSVLLIRKIFRWLKVEFCYCYNLFHLYNLCKYNKSTDFKLYFLFTKELDYEKFKTLILTSKILITVICIICNFGWYVLLIFGGRFREMKNSLSFKSRVGMTVVAIKVRMAIEARMLEYFWKYAATCVVWDMVYGLLGFVCTLLLVIRMILFVLVG